MRKRQAKTLKQRGPKERDGGNGRRDNEREAIAKRTEKGELADSEGVLKVGRNSLELEGSERGTREWKSGGHGNMGAPFLSATALRPICTIADL
jgi:hypothetical protein